MTSWEEKFRSRTNRKDKRRCHGTSLRICWKSVGKKKKRSWSKTEIIMIHTGEFSVHVGQREEKKAVLKTFPSSSDLGKIVRRWCRLRRRCTKRLEHVLRESKLYGGTITSAIVYHRCFDPLFSIQVKEISFLHDNERIRRMKDRDIKTSMHSAQWLWPGLGNSTRNHCQDRPLIGLNVVALNR